MPKAVYLAQVLRAAGLTVEEYPLWKDRGRPSDGGLLDIQAIIGHHTAGPLTGDRPSLGTVVNGRPGLTGPLGQLFLARSGVWVVIAAGKSNSNGKVTDLSYSNAHTLNIEAEAAGLGPKKAPADWPAVQYNSYAKGVAALLNHLKLPTARHLGHKEVAAPLGRKTDPSFDMKVFRQVVDRYRDQLAEAAGRTTGRPLFSLDRLLYHRKNKPLELPVIAVIQRRLVNLGYPLPKSRQENGVYDGIYGPEVAAAVKRFQRKSKLVADGVVGKMTTKALGGRWTGE